MFQRIEFACASLLLGAVVILIAVASVARALDAPIIWSIEIAQLIFVWMCIIAADLALQSDRHFGMRLLLDNVPRGLRKAIEIVNIVVLISLLAFLTYYAWGNVILMYPRLDGALLISGSYFHASMLVGFLLPIRTLVAQLIGRINTVNRG